MRFLPFYLFTFLFLSCGPEGGKFRLSGRLRNINQGEFLVYSPDGGFVGVDTIKVRNGRFSYEKEVRKEVMLMIVFPNFSEQVVIAEPGEEVEVKGDATHLREMTINGTDANDDLTKLRIRINKLSPPEIPSAIARYIEENPTSIVSMYLLDKYFVNAKTPDYIEGQRLAALMLKANPDNGRLRRLKTRLDGLKNGRLQAQLPTFSATDINGQKISSSLLKGKVGVITTWASWNYPSTDIQKRLRRLQKKNPQTLALISICLDGDKRECRRRIDRDSLLWTQVYDGQMFQSPLINKLGLFMVPSMVVVNKQGKIIARDIEQNKVEEEIGKLLQ
ncbi:MAG: AhpC/TSA family protein [Prevotella sp.]|nr:AhpC/TSA family protein [Prevotella sp.]